MASSSSDAAPAPSITETPAGNADDDTTGTEALMSPQEHGGDASMSGLFEMAPCEEKSVEEDRPSSSHDAKVMDDAQSGTGNNDNLFSLFWLIAMLLFSFHANATYFFSISLSFVKVHCSRRRRKRKKGGERRRRRRRRWLMDGKLFLLIVVLLFFFLVDCHVTFLLLL